MYVSFAKGLPSLYESILFRPKFANPLLLTQLVKYEKMMRIEEQVCLAKIKNELYKPGFLNTNVYVLPSKQILINYPLDGIIFVLNKSGDLILSKEKMNYGFEVNAKNIVVCPLITNELVEIYNFKCELVHWVNLRQRCSNFKLNNYEIALSNTFNVDEIIITCYNYKTVKSKMKEIRINKDELKSNFDFTEVEGVRGYFLEIEWKIFHLN